MMEQQSQNVQAVNNYENSFHKPGKHLKIARHQPEGFHFCFLHLTDDARLDNNCRTVGKKAEPNCFRECKVPESFGFI